MNREQLLEDLKSDEGFRSSVYLDTEGFQTIGYGFLVDSRKGGGIPPEVAEFWLQWIVDRMVPSLRRALPWFDTKPEPVQRALCNMAYQMGLSGLLGFRRMLAYIQNDDYEGAYQEALDSQWAIQTPNRARRRAALIRSGAQQRP